MNNELKQYSNRRFSRRFRDFWIIHGKEVRTVSIVVVSCFAVAAFAFEPVEKIGYERAVVEDFGVREGSKRPGVRLWVRTKNGRRRLLSSRAYMPDLRVGSEICLLRTRGKIRNVDYLRPALPSRCLAGTAGGQDI
ncbi:hypothetical protein ACXYMO_00580 [Arenibacterium sp. CAU 1754]